MQLDDSNLASCELVAEPDPNDPTTFGWCPSGSAIRQAYIIRDDIITTDSVVIATLGNIPSAMLFQPRYVVRFVNPVLKAFNFHCNGAVDNGVPLNYAIINP